MWICPNCRAENYERGPCGCCGYFKGWSLECPAKMKRCWTPSETDSTDQPMKIWYGENIC